MKSKLFQALAIVLILESGLIHFISAQGAYEEAAILGYFFVANFLIALVAAYGIYRTRRWGWALGAALAAGSIAGYLWNTTAVRPGLDSWGLAAIGVESLFLLLIPLRPWRIGGASDTQTPTPLWFRFSLVLASVFLLVLVNGLAFQNRLDSGDLASTFTVAGANRTPLTSPEEMERVYGMRIEQVAITALDSIVDVRIRIIDPDKAYPILEDYSALLVDEESIILAPYKHDHARVRAGGMYFMFFPTQNHTAHPGSEVSLVFEGLRMAPVVAQ